MIWVPFWRYQISWLDFMMANLISSPPIIRNATFIQGPICFECCTFEILLLVISRIYKGLEKRVLQINVNDL